MAKILAVTYGANLLISARREDRLLELKSELEKSAGVKIDVCVADLSKLDDVDRLIETASKGRALYGAVLNAGITHFGPYAELSWESFRTMLDTNAGDAP